MADSVTQVRVAGPVGTKRNLAILGDGFAAADQATYNNWVQTVVLDGVFGNDYFFEDLSAWNIFRVNLEFDGLGHQHARLQRNGDAGRPLR